MRFQRSFFAVYSRVYDYLWDHALTASLAERVADEATGVGGRVLEVGSGTGLITRVLVGRGLDVVPSEPDPHMRARFEQRFPDLPCMHWLLDEVESTADGYAGVVAVNVVHMLDDADAAVRQMLALASDGGVVIVATPSPSASVPVVMRAMKRHGVGLTRRAGFLLVHLLLAPLRSISGAGIPMDPTDIVWSVAPRVRATVGETTDLFVWQVADRGPGG